MATYYKPNPKQLVFGRGDEWQLKLLHPSHPDFPHFDDEYKDAGLTLIAMVRRTEERDWHPLGITEKRYFRVYVGARIHHNGTIGQHDLKPDFAALLYDAIVSAAARAWGDNWNAALSEVFGINRRTFQRDRFLKHLLPIPILQQIAYIASHEDVEAFGQALRTASLYERSPENREKLTSIILESIDFHYDPSPAMKESATK